jgi:hypothetical protein
LRGQPTGRLKLGTVLDPVVLRVGDLLVRALERCPQISSNCIESCRAMR